MRNTVSRLERTFFFLFSIGLFLAGIAATVLAGRAHPSNLRIAYGIEHLGAALFGSALLTALVAVLREFLPRRLKIENIPGIYLVAALTVVFCIYWLPVFLASGFVQDDWMLLSAASIRKIVLHHPTYSWYALDTINGNFRPLSTVLYFGYMLQWFGPHAKAFLAANFVVNLLGSLAAFALTRELGYSRVAGMAASILYMSRALLFTEIGWPCDFCDGAVVLLCALAALVILKANRKSGFKVFALHLIAWGLFFIATLSKQSSFVMPLIVAAILFFRPGTAPVVSMNRRIRSALIAFAIYSATAGYVFFHAKTLMHSQTPYPIKLTLHGVAEPLSFSFWYLIGAYFPAKYDLLNYLILLLGAMLSVAVCVFAWKKPRILGLRPRDGAFLLVAAFSSITMFCLLPTIVDPYYGVLFSLWMSIALGISLTSFGAVTQTNRAARISCFIFCLLAVTGFLEVRLMQTALYPSGGYLWGTFGADLDRTYYAQLSDASEIGSHADTAMLIDAGGYPSYYASMTLLLYPNIRRIVAYDSASGSYWVNNRNGLRPANDLEGLTDAAAFQWTVPIDSDAATRILSNRNVLWVRFRGRQIETSTTDSIPQTKAAAGE